MSVSPVQFQISIFHGLRLLDIVHFPCEKSVYIGNQSKHHIYLDTEHDGLIAKLSWDHQSECFRVIHGRTTIAQVYSSPEEALKAAIVYCQKNIISPANTSQNSEQSVLMLIEDNFILICQKIIFPKIPAAWMHSEYFQDIYPFVFTSLMIHFFLQIMLWSTPLSAERFSLGNIQNNHRLTKIMFNKPELQKRTALRSKPTKPKIQKYSEKKAHPSSVPNKEKKILNKNIAEKLKNKNQDLPDKNPFPELEEQNHFGALDEKKVNEQAEHEKQVDDMLGATADTLNNEKSLDAAATAPEATPDDDASSGEAETIQQRGPKNTTLNGEDMEANGEDFSQLHEEGGKSGNFNQHKKQGVLDIKAIKRVIESHRQHIMTCYQTALQRGLQIEGRIAMAFVIDENGRVENAYISESTIDDEKLKTCILKRLQSWRFPPPKGGSVEVVYPFVFRAS
jgi:TonB family protein